jgi:hypothetical protein
MHSGNTLVRSARNRKKNGQSEARAARIVKKHPRSRFVLCVDDGGDDISLYVGKVYEALPTEKIPRDHGLIRVIDNEGEDYLYSQDQFVDIKLPRAAHQAVLRARGM